MFRSLLKIDDAALRGVNELDLFPCTEQRLRALQAFRHYREWSPKSAYFWFGIAYGIVVAVILVPWCSAAFSVFSLVAQILLMTPIALASGLIARFGGVRLVRRSASVFLRKELLSCDVPVCLKCGYDLRGTVSERCSECGRELDGRVREILTEKRSGGGDVAKSNVRTVEGDQ